MKANENPFRSAKVEQIRYALGPTPLDQLADTALQLGQCCLLGPHGTGKTTLLEDLEPHLQACNRSTHWFRLNLDSSQDERRASIYAIRTLKPHSVCLFDGAEVLNRWQQYRLRRIIRRQKLGLIATLHRKNPLPVLYHTEPNWQLTEQLVRRLAKDHCSPELIQQAQLAFEQNGGNVREVFRACYWKLAH